MYHWRKSGPLSVYNDSWKTDKKKNAPTDQPSEKARGACKGDRSKVMKTILSNLAQHRTQRKKEYR